MRNRFAALALFLCGIPLTASAQTYGPDTDAVSLVTAMVNRGDFGEIEVAAKDAGVRLYVNDEAVEETGRVFLVEPGTRVTLRGEAPGAAGEAGATRTFDDRGMFRSTTYSETVWEAEVDDRLLKSADGSIEWRPGTSGRASYVSVEIARLDVHRPSSAMATEGVAVPAVLSHGRAGVLLVPGVAFDRNGDGMLAGQNIGIYPNEKANDAPNSVKSRAELYAPPATFFMLGERIANQPIAGHFTLADLAPPVFEGETTGRHVAVSPRLIAFLSAFEENVAAAKLDPQKLYILRGYLSPTDRRRLERQGVSLAEFTRFQYGDAAAIVYDANERDGNNVPLMTDLDGDGAVGAGDAAVLAKIAKETMDQLGIFGAIGSSEKFEGPGPAKDTPYLHVDLRGWYVPLD